MAWGWGEGRRNWNTALDLTRSLFLKRERENGNRYLSIKETSVNDLKQQVGTVVLSKDFGRLWYVNGELVFDASKSASNFDSSSVPFLSVKGKIEITSVELGDIAQ